MTFVVLRHLNDISQVTEYGGIHERIIIIILIINTTKAIGRMHFVQSVLIITGITLDAALIAKYLVQIWVTVRLRGGGVERGGGMVGFCITDRGRRIKGKRGGGGWLIKRLNLVIGWI